MRGYVPAGMNGKVHIVPPAIDPLAPKNMALSPEDAVFVCNQFGLDVGWNYFNETVAHAEGDPDVHILNNFNNVGAIEVNAFQSHADVLIQKSTREGFGLTVSEAIWKAKPFIGGRVGGIPIQVRDGETGYLVDSVDECARRIGDVLRDPALGKDLGRRGKEYVRAHFLMLLLQMSA